MPRVAPAVSLNQTTKAALDQLVRSPSTPQSLVPRGRIVLAAAAGQANQQIAGALAIPEVTVGKWRRGFARQGLEGLQDAPRSGRPVKHGPEIIQRVQQRACQKPRYYSRWSVRTLAADLGLPRSIVHQIIVGLYLNPPENALVLCVDEKTGIQALDRTQPLLPLTRFIHEGAQGGLWGDEITPNMMASG